MNIAASVPVFAVELTVNVPLPVLVTVNVCGLDVVLIATVPKDKDVGFTSNVRHGYLAPRHSLKLTANWALSFRNSPQFSNHGTDGNVRTFPMRGAPLAVAVCSP